MPIFIALIISCSHRAGECDGPNPLGSRILERLRAGRERRTRRQDVVHHEHRLATDEHWTADGKGSNDVFTTLVFRQAPLPSRMTDTADDMIGTGLPETFRHGGRKIGALVVTAVQPMAEGRRHRHDQIDRFGFEARPNRRLQPIGKIIAQPQLGTELEAVDQFARKPLEPEGARRPIESWSIFAAVGAEEFAVELRDITSAHPATAVNGNKR